jgi:2-isopropylmalate synthase
LFGLDQVVEIGPLSGKSNVIFWLEKRGIPPTEDLVERILAAAKQSNQILSDQEIESLCGGASKTASRPSL